MYKTRAKCIVCENTDLSGLFDEDKSFPIGNFPVERGYPCKFMPYNVQICELCQTYQLKYEGDLELIYGNNHARAYGSIRKDMDVLFSEFVLISGASDFIEIGAGSGSLANELILNTKGNYVAIDPSYWGNTEGRRVIWKYIEDADISSSNIPNIVMSHVFEHFYEPSKILNVLANANVQNIFLNFPNLEHCVQKGINYVLTPEHSFYITNDNLVRLFLKHGFAMKRMKYYNDYAVFFHFVKEERHVPPSWIDRPFKSVRADVKNFYNILDKRVRQCTSIVDLSKKEGHPLYIFPCSIHPLFLFAFGLDHASFDGVLDNNPDKIGKLLYGTNLECASFNETIQTSKSKIILLVGGQFNREVRNRAEANPNNSVFSV